MKWLTMAHDAGADLELLEERAKEWQNWSAFREGIFDIINSEGN